MERKFISINELKKVLSPKEMRNVLGGSGGGSEYCDPETPCTVTCGDYTVYQPGGNCVDLGWTEQCIAAGGTYRCTGFCWDLCL